MVYDLIIIGCGPAGIAAAIYAKRANLNFIILEKNSIGGQLLNTLAIENYPGITSISGFDFSKNMEAQLEKLQVNIVFEEAREIKKIDQSIKIVFTYSKSYQTKFILLASGLAPKKLQIKNEEKFIAKGISWCALCDGYFYKNKQVAVVGSGNSAIEEALYLANMAKQVFVIVRKDFLKADAITIKKLKQQKNVQFLYNQEIIDFFGEEFLNKIALKNNLNQKITYLNVDGVFEYIGNIPMTYFLKLFNVLDDKGYIKVDQHNQTSIPGLFAAGDVNNNKPKQIITAMSDGVKALKKIIQLLK